MIAGSNAAPSPLPAKIPKVYNAIISTDQQLKPSKAYPLIQPVLHEQYNLYPYGPFGGFDPFFSPFSPYPVFPQLPKPPSKDSGEVRCH